MHSNDTASNEADLQRRIADLEDQNRNLQIALTNARVIGAAIGIVMHELKITQDDAFQLISKTSQNRGTKLRSVAEEIVVTGTLSR